MVNRDYIGDTQRGQYAIRFPRLLKEMCGELEGVEELLKGEYVICHSSDLVRGGKSHYRLLLVIVAGYGYGDTSSNPGPD